MDKDIIEFNGAKIYRFEADILEIIESTIGRPWENDSYFFELVNSIDFDPAQFEDNYLSGLNDQWYNLSSALFSTRNNRVIGIAFRDINICDGCEDLKNYHSNEENNLINIQNRNTCKNCGILVPKIINKFSALEELYIRGKIDLHQDLIPEALFDIKTLKLLFLEDCLPSSISPKIGKLTRLKSLYLANNDLIDLPDTIKNMKSLSHLDLSYNHFKLVPDSIFELENLISLRLHGNRLVEFPELIIGLKNLEFIDVSQNKIKTIPNSISELKKLKILKS